MNNKLLTKIHGIRGLAVWSVLLFHFFEVYFPGGYVGVDLFFILSGYLVTMSIFETLKRKKENSDQSNAKDFIVSFYTKRFSRIFPMLIFSSFISLILYLLFTGPSKMNHTISYFLSSIVGFTNIKLFRSSSDYFAENQSFNFYTHTWSLGIEEQFYLVVSLVIFTLLATSRNYENKVNSFFKYSFIVSLCLCVIWSFSEKVTTAPFYLLPFRWWQLALGVLLYLNKAKIQKKIEIINTSFFNNIAFLILVLSLFIPYNQVYSPFPQTLPTLLAGAYFIIFASEKKFSYAEMILNSRFFQFAGTISYSLYLNHWIILVLSKYIFGYSLIVSILGCFISLILSVITYYAIEKPCLNYFRGRPRLSISLLIGFIFISYALYVMNNKTKYTQNALYLGNFVNLEASSWDDDLVCHGKVKLAKHKDPLATCLLPDRTIKPGAVFLLGDSHAVQMYFLIAKTFEQTKYQVKYINMESGDDPYGFIIQDIDVKKTPAIFEYVVKNSQSGDIVFLTFASFRLDEIDADRRNLGFEVWRQYIKTLSDKGVRVILVKDSPSFNKDNPIELCAIQYQIFKNSSHCEISLEAANKKRVNQLTFYAKLLDIRNVYEFDLFPRFCDEAKCRFYENNELLFFDYNHYTKKVSEEMAPMLTQFLNQNGLVANPSSH